MSGPAPPEPLSIRTPIENIPTATSLRRLAVVAAGESGHEIIDRGLRVLECPDDGEPNPARPGNVAPGAAPCGRPEPCDVGDCAPCRASGGRGHPDYLALADELKKLHLLKSGGYGTGTDPFANFTQVAEASGEPRYLYPILRSIEKLTRCLSLHAQGRADELEEEFKDVASLNLCAAAMHRADSA